MIWARPLHSGDASALWVRSSLTPEGVGLLRSALESAALITGLDDDTRELLVELVDTGWVGGSGDAAIVRYSNVSIEAWLARLPEASELATAFKRLRAAPERLPPTAIGGASFVWGARTFVMGVVNVTPDSFSDGGKFADAKAAIAHAQALVKAGADLIDIGGESTRPGAAEVPLEDELKRVLPVIEGLKGSGVVLSIDTRKPEVAKQALAAGAHVVNDVGGLRDDEMIDVIARTGAHACVMHMQGSPQTMQDNPRYADVGTEVLDALEGAIRRAETKGVARSKLLVDPGIGFGKTAAHNLFLLQRAGDLRLLGCPVLVGVSRKKFLGTLTGETEPGHRLMASAATVGILAAQGAVDVVRVHDVAETKEALAVADAVRLARDGGSRF